MRWVRLTDAETGRQLEGEELWNDEGTFFYGQYIYNSNVCKYIWNGTFGMGQAHTREEARDGLLSSLVTGRIK